MDRCFHVRTDSDLLLFRMSDTISLVSFTNTKGCVMKTLTATGVSFRDDPQALGLLLLDILQATRRNDGRISESEIATAARNLGHRGPLSSVFALLLAQGFLSREDEQYIITETNSAAINQFNLEYEEPSPSPCLSENEKMLLFESIGVNGSEVGRLALRVDRLIAELNEELSLVSVLRDRNRQSTLKNKEFLNRPTRDEGILDLLEQAREFLLRLTATLVKAESDGK
jgi:hypothetical protein